VEVAIISGRALADVQARIGLPELNYVGNHGLELTGKVLDGMCLPRSAPAQLELETALERIRQEIGEIPGLYIEDKTLTASIHFRSASEEYEGEIGYAVQAALADLPDLIANPGRRIWEIRPRFGWDKGVALRNMLEHVDLPEEAGIYIGDDTTDEDAFRAIPRGLTFYAGHKEFTAAHWLVDSPQDTVQLLEWIHRERTGST
jgi:trehalose 6-phosphate phosphatase